MTSFRFSSVVALAAAVWLGAAPLQGQQRDTAQLRRQAQEQLGRDVSQDEIMRRLRESGMTRSQVRSRLQSMGYDPGLADAYFDAIESGGAVSAEGPPSSRLIDAMAQLGVPVLSDSLIALTADSLRSDSLHADSIALDSIARDSLSPAERLPIFGMNLFRSASQFSAVTWGPVGPDYRLGPGDELVLILTGDVELAYDLAVTREGFVVIPDVGQVSVNGLTIGQLEQRLYDRLGRVYSGVERGPGATTHFQVSLGRLRTNQIYLIGEIRRPGAYQVSAVATVLNALYNGAGPSQNGSFRNVQVRRGTELVATVDLYEYLLTGTASGDVRLEHGDRVFVPVVGPRVSIDGEIRRPARYEIRPGETLQDLLVFAGGLKAAAIARRIQIDRVLPPSERRPGVDRVLIDVPIETLAGGGAPVALRDGDHVTVFAVSEERRERVIVEGEVRRPGVYQWSPGMTLSGLIADAEGLTEAAYAQRAQIYRLNETTGTRYLIPARMDGESASQVRIADRDSVVVLSRADLATADSVVLSGFVKNPGTYPLADGMSVRDLILAAGGFTHGADVSAAEIARMPSPLERTDTTAVVYRVALTSDQTVAEAARIGADRLTPEWQPQADEAALFPGDRVHVGRAPGYMPPRSVIITGEVRRPGRYVLAERQERVADLIARAGGLSDEAYAQGFQIVRDSLLLGTDLVEALSDRSDAENILLADGDSLHVPTFDGTVHVTGAVGFESRVLYQSGAHLDYYIEQAGGYSRQADKRRVSVTYQNGERETIDRFLWIELEPEPGPGSMVFVPSLPEAVASDGINWSTVIQRTTSALGTIATLIFAYVQLTN